MPPYFRAFLPILRPPLLVSMPPARPPAKPEAAGLPRSWPRILSALNTSASVVVGSGPGRDNLAAPAVAAAPSERVLSREPAAEDQGVHLVRALVGVDALEVQHVPHGGELHADAVAAEDRPAGTCRLERHGHVVPLAQRDLEGTHAAVLVLQARQVEHQHLGQRDLRAGVEI